MYKKNIGKWVELSANIGMIVKKKFNLEEKNVKSCWKTSDIHSYCKTNQLKSTKFIFAFKSEVKSESLVQNLIKKTSACRVAF